MIKPTQDTGTYPCEASSLAAPSVAPPAPGRFARIQFFMYLTVTLGVLIFLLWPASKNVSTVVASTAASQQSAVRLTETGRIRITPDSPLFKKLQISIIKPERIAVPVLTVTGTVVASLRQVKGAGKDWQFNSPELLSSYTDWQKAAADIAFNKNQLNAIRQLSDNRVQAQEVLVRRLKKLVEAGTDTESDLAAAENELLQAQIQGRKELHEAETAWRLAQRSEAALSRQLQQEGVEPELLQLTGAEVDIVVADVPEALVSRVKLGQSCEAAFLGIAGKTFTGTVRSLSPVLSKERRTLRVLFTISDPEDQLRPGMFADIGLGTDAREALLVPLSGVVHVGRSDYLLVRADSGDLLPTAVQVGELHDDAVEILEGLKSGDAVVGQGAILLKPYIAEIFHTSSGRKGRCRRLRLRLRAGHDRPTD